MVTDDEPFTTHGLHSEIAKRHTLGICISLIPPVQDSGNLIVLPTPGKSLGLLGLSVFITAIDFDLLKNHTLTISSCRKSAKHYAFFGDLR